MVTGAIFKGLRFDDIDSKQYGVYITGEAVFDAPTRDVEMIEIPGRNGSYAFDKGRFNNIKVTYPAGIFGKDESEFAQAISEFRNALASKKGYCRLTDDYNPNEYRMGVYAGGLEVAPAQLKAGEFDITFNCKPQRFLTSGEIRSLLPIRATLENPTLFDAKPLLELTGYGNLVINDDVITVNPDPIGYISLPITATRTGTTKTYTFPTDNLMSGDSIYLKNLRENYSATITDGYIFNSVSKASSTGTAKGTATQKTSTWIDYTLKFDQIGFNYGTTKTTASSWTYNLSTTAGAMTMTITLTASYDGDGTVTVTPSTSATGSTWYLGQGEDTPLLSSISAQSTKPITDTTTYIDLDIGEAYKINDGEIVPVNNSVSIPAELPVLVPGENNTRYDNTFSRVYITPRWWIV